MAAGSINKVTLLGNLGKDPEVRTTQDGQKIVNLTMATSEIWKDRQSGERKERTQWHRVVIFNNHLGDIAERFLRKGSKVYVEGSLQTHKWTDRTGIERNSTEVVISRFRGELTMVDAPRGSEGTGNGSGYRERAPEQRAAVRGVSSDNPSRDTLEGDDLDYDSLYPSE
jgi:single-strand DNA-binding protein